MIRNLVCAFFLLFYFSNCRKQTSSEEIRAQMPLPRAETAIQGSTNPFNIRNVQSAYETLRQRTGGASRMSNPSNYPEFIYFKFNPANLTQAQFLALENDTTGQILDIPFGDSAVYNNANLDSAAIEQLKDGNLYVVTSSTNSIVSTFQSASNLQMQILDTLVQIPDSDTALQNESLRTAGYRLNGVCLFKQPSGHVYYWDEQLNNSAGQWEPVRGIQVWALVFGIPVHTYSDGSGYYQIPTHFSFGTVMGTKAKNNRVNIKPLDTHGNLAQDIITIMGQFIIGSQHIDGWVSSCDMRNDKDFRFGGHTQVRYWSQLLNAYYFHDQYCNQEGISNAPQGMVCYAQWGAGTTAGLGRAGTPMIGHISLPMTYIEGFINNMFGANSNFSSNYPNFFQLMTGLEPDMTFRVNQGGEPQLYNSSLAQTAFHELGHASHFRQVGMSWWIQLAIDEIPDQSVPGNPYGDGSHPDDARISLAESWAEYIGMNFAGRRYPNGSIWHNGGNAVIANLLETEEYFYGGQWMPYGLFHDLNDGANETWDNISGATIQQMYNSFQPNIADWCGYLNKFIQDQPTFNSSFEWLLFAYYHHSCGTKYFSAAINQTIQKNDCPSGNGSYVQVSVPYGMFYSTVSQAAANAQAASYAQTLANQQGSCPIVNVSIYAENNHGTSVTLLFHNVGTGQDYTFTISAHGGETVGDVPPGTYNVTLTPQSSGWYNYTVACANPDAGPGAMTFSYVDINSSCNSILID